MASYIDFLTELGFGEILENEFSLEDSDGYDIECFGQVCEDNIAAMRDEFDDSFIIEVFLFFNSVFMRNDFCEMIEKVKEELGTDMWSTLIVYEWNETGKSSVFELMDNLEIGYFESNLSGVCEKIRTIWVNDYGDDEL